MGCTRVECVNKDIKNPTYHINTMKGTVFFCVLVFVDHHLEWCGLINQKSTKVLFFSNLITQAQGKITPRKKCASKIQSNKSVLVLLISFAVKYVRYDFSIIKINKPSIYSLVSARFIALTLDNVLDLCMQQMSRCVYNLNDQVGIINAVDWRIQKTTHSYRHTDASDG